MALVLRPETGPASQPNPIKFKLGEIYTIVDSEAAGYKFRNQEPFIVLGKEFDSTEHNGCWKIYLIGKKEIYYVVRGSWLEQNLIDNAKIISL
jgi:hypothetical protein